MKIPVNTKIDKHLVSLIDLEIKRKSVPSRTAMIEKALYFYFETFKDHDERLEMIEIKLEKVSELVDQVLSRQKKAE